MPAVPSSRRGVVRWAAHARHRIEESAIASPMRSEGLAIALSSIPWPAGPVRPAPPNPVATPGMFPQSPLRASALISLAYAQLRSHRVSNGHGHHGQHGAWLRERRRVPAVPSSRRGVVRWAAHARHGIEKRTIATPCARRALRSRVPRSHCRPDRSAGPTESAATPGMSSVSRRASALSGLCVSVAVRLKPDTDNVRLPRDAKGQIINMLARVS